MQAVARERGVRRAINARLGRDPAAPLVAVVDASPLDPARLRAALAAHPALLRADARVESVRARALAARHAARRPRMSAGTGVFVEPSMGVGYGLMVGLELPWIGGRMNGERRVAEAEQRLAEAERESMARRLAIDLELGLAELERTTSAIEAFETTTLPALRRSVDATSSGIGSGAVSIADVFLARVSLTDAELERTELLGERLRAESALHALLAVLDAMDLEPGEGNDADEASP
jgi:outer membrane protein TolC